MTAVLGYSETDPTDRSSQSLFLVGDLLVSSVAERSDLVIPTIGPIQRIFPDGSGFVPVGFAQKLVMFGQHFAAGWAGPYVVARSFFAELFRHFANGTLTGDTIAEHLSELTTSELGRQLQVICALEDVQGRTDFQTNVAAAEVPPLKNVTALGSGRDSLLAALAATVANPPEVLTTPGAQMQLRLQRLLGGLFQREVVTARSVREYYGGGYEAIFQTTRGFEKLDKVLHCFSRATVRGGAPLVNPPHRIVYQRYVQDSLLITSYRLDAVTAASGGQSSRSVEPLSLLVPPIHRDPAPAELEAANEAARAVTQTTLHVHLEVLDFELRQTLMWSHMASGTASADVTVVPDSKGLKIDITDALADTLQELTVRAYQLER